MKVQDIPNAALARLRRGTVIPAHPLLLTPDRRLDERRQRAVTRYYMEAGAGGVAVGVHTTQFAIRNVGLYEPVLQIAAEEVRAAGEDRILIAGVTGQTDQALAEANIARAAGYHAVLLNLAQLKGQTHDAILTHCRAIAAQMPVVGFALLPAVGGFHLPYTFWRAFAQIENVVAIKMAPFDRYRTLEIVRAVHDAGTADQVTLYTGNDDHIVLDLIQPFMIRGSDGAQTRMRIRGGLLGHWSVWVKPAVDLLARIHALPDGADIPEDLLALDSAVTDCNAAIYDAPHNLAGCIPGCLEVLRRQGLAAGTTCLDPAQTLSPGQSDEIDRVYAAYPEMNDDAFVAANLARWLGDAHAHAAQ